MKFNLFILLTLAISSCSLQEAQSSEKNNPLPPNDAVTFLSDPTADAITVKFAVKSGNDLYFSDSDVTYLWKSGNILKSGYRQFAVEKEIITLDSSGDQTSSFYLPEVPTRIKIINSDAYYCVEYPPAKAYALGGMYRTYSEFYKNNSVTSAWYNNQFKCKDIVFVGAEVFAINQHGRHYTIEGSYTNVFHANEIIMHNLNIPNKTIGFNLNTEDYGFNYAMNSNQWILYNGIYYAENGYTWTEAGGLIEGATALHGWNTYPYPLTEQNPFAQAPVLLKLGVYHNKLYWIECNSGYLFSYDPNTDQITQKFKLYTGDGMRSTGIHWRSNLKPLLVDSILYFSQPGSIDSLDMGVGFIKVFFATDGEMIKYD